MNINQLPDLCIYTIFDYLPLRDQWQNLDVCQYWRTLQCKLFLARKRLILVLHGAGYASAARQLLHTNSFSISKQHLLIQNSNLSKKPLLRALECLAFLGDKFNGYDKLPLVIIVSMKIRLSSDDFTILKSDDHPMNSSDDNLNFILMNRMKNGLSSDEFIQIHQK